MYHGTRSPIFPTRRTATPTRRASNGAQLTLLASARAEQQRANISLLVSEIGTRPEPKDAIRDFERGRPSSHENAARVEVAVISAATPEQVHRYCDRSRAGLLALVATETPSMDAAIMAEIDAQAEADKQQLRMRHYVATGDVVGMERVIADTAKHVREAQQVHQLAIMELARMRHTRPSRPSFHVVDGGRAS